MRAHLSWRSVVLTLMALSAAPLAAAQAPASSSAPAASSSGAPAAPSASASAAVPRPATGYGWSSPKPKAGPKGATPTPRPVARTVHPAPTGPIATLPGFEMQADGSSRLFVALTQTVPVEEHKAQGVITYVLKGAHVVLRNNQNALVTVHFNTPVVRARLVPTGNDLHFIVELRAAVSPTWKVTPGKDGTSLLMVDFPKGSYLPTGGAPDAAAPGTKP